MPKASIICPICDRALQMNEGLVIRPLDNGTTDIMRILHVDYSQPITHSRILHESDNYTRLAIDF